MPSTRGQKAKTRNSREVDMMSDFELWTLYLDVNPIERDFQMQLELRRAIVTLSQEAIETFTSELT